MGADGGLVPVRVQVPVTVAHFLDMVTGKAGSSYKGSIIHRSLPGQYVMAGRQGAVERGEVKPPTELERNPELVRSQAFLLGHERPGTVSLALSENDDEEGMRLDAAYRNVEFLITTGQSRAQGFSSGACSPAPSRAVGALGVCMGFSRGLHSAVMPPPPQALVLRHNWTGGTWCLEQCSKVSQGEPRSATVRLKTHRGGRWWRALSMHAAERTCQATALTRAGARW